MRETIGRAIRLGRGDRSQQDDRPQQTRGEELKALLTDSTRQWPTHLAQEFDVRRFAVGSRLETINDFKRLDFEDPHSDWHLALRQVAQRFADRPVAGVLLFSDGNATDERPPGWSTEGLPPIYPVVIGDAANLKDVAVDHVAVSTTAFEDAPVTVTAEIAQQGFAGQEVVAKIIDDKQAVVKEEILRLPDDGRATSVRFQVRPIHTGVSFYTVSVEPRVQSSSASASGERGPALSEQRTPLPNPLPKGRGDNLESQGRGDNLGSETSEATIANNQRQIVVDRGSGPYRILYVSGRPNWDFKFFNRALEQDEQVKLTALIRIAKREPKFDWRGRAGESSNPLFRGFDGVDAETERFDQPVIVRLNTKDAVELRDGFPKTEQDLYPFLAVILDDLEAEFFTTAQFELLERFVSERGGSLLMLGGQESFSQGGFRKTPLARVLPVSLDESPEPSPARRFRLSLTREGWLAPWARLRSTEEEETARLKGWPLFHTLNVAGREKPGATVIAEAIDQTGAEQPAVVAHRYGEGRCAAVLIGDLWRAQLDQTDEQRAKDDLNKSWRQLVRWLIADVPERIEVRPAAVDDDPSVRRVEVRLKMADFQPQDNSSVTITATLPDGTTLSLPAEPSLAEAGLYEALIATAAPGPYRAEVRATDSEGVAIGTAVAGWVHDPLAEEYRRVAPNREWLSQIAKETGGEVIAQEDLDGFVRQLTRKPAPITETTTTPLWQHPLVLLAIIGCLCGEWGLRRRRGLP